MRKKKIFMLFAIVRNEEILHIIDTVKVTWKVKDKEFLGTTASAYTLNVSGCQAIKYITKCDMEINNISTYYENKDMKIKKCPICFANEKDIEFVNEIEFKNISHDNYHMDIHQF